jgi:hypothetical protein
VPFGGGDQWQQDFLEAFPTNLFGSDSSFTAYPQSLTNLLQEMNHALNIE